ncbi:tRNA (adenosine(37)-N6)-dimethylallyltransferase MiaA [Leucobacter sp. GX24907]
MRLGDPAARAADSTSPPRIWAIVGATGTGKSELSLDLAEAIEGIGRTAEIINADAMQLYRGMDIGTAKVPMGARRGIRHHLFDLLAPSEEATVARYQSRVREIITELLHDGKDAILVGGSGLYVSSAIFDFRFPPRDARVRAELERELDEDGVAPLLERLRGLAPEVADSVDARNPRRVVRALEVALLGGDAQVVLPSEPAHWQPVPDHRPMRIIGVHCERGALVERLDRRVERMWADGLLEEVRGLLPEGIAEGPTASRAIGYAQALAQLQGEASEAEAIAETQALTRRYARRQVSWFKRYPGIEWVDGPDLAAIQVD